MSVPFDFPPDLIDALHRAPDRTHAGRMAGEPFSARVSIPDYSERIADHYGAPHHRSSHIALHELTERTGLPVGFRHFGVVVEFESAPVFDLHDSEARLCESAKALIDRFGVVAVRNARLRTHAAVPQQSNKFEDLNFHLDRTSAQPTQYSLYIRDPANPGQGEPRQSSTLFVCNLVAHLQHVAESGAEMQAPDPLPFRHYLFRKDVEAHLGGLILDQRWDAPSGVPEFAMINNRTVRHASYYRGRHEPGWPLAVRYLA